MFLFLVGFSLFSSLFQELRENEILKKVHSSPSSLGCHVRILIYRTCPPFTYITQETYSCDTSCYFVIYQQFLRYHLQKKSKI